MFTPGTADPRRPNKLRRHGVTCLHSFSYLFPRFVPSSQDAPPVDPAIDYFNFVGMLLSICGLLFEVSLPMITVVLFFYHIDEVCCLGGSYVCLTDLRECKNWGGYKTVSQRIHVGCHKFGPLKPTSFTLPSFRLSVSALVICYMHNPQPMPVPW